MPLKTETAPGVAARFRVGEWLVDPRLNQLSNGDEVVQLELRVMDLLVCLAGRAPARRGV
jgi:DNA-binding winged helix-turn-helix (wHTH) protein